MTGVQNALRRAALGAFPHGGQKVARRNAWAGMTADAAMAKDRQEADTALALAQRTKVRQAR